jgi:hypothetical protein
MDSTKVPNTINATSAIPPAVSQTRTGLRRTAWTIRPTSATTKTAAAVTNITGLANTSPRIAIAPIATFWGFERALIHPSALLGYSCTYLSSPVVRGLYRPEGLRRDSLGQRAELKSDPRPLTCESSFTLLSKPVYGIGL